MSKRPLPASRIIIDGEALRELLREWGIEAERCQLWNAGVNDHYLVSSRQEAWMLRVYRKGWRSRPEIDWELGLLDHARAAGLPVAHAIAVGGELVHGISTVQGERDAVLFTYAPGKAAAFPPVDEYIDRYADLAGRLHEAGRSYIPRGDRDPKRTEPWDRFLAAYQAIRSLSEADHAAVPWFVLARAIWLAGFHAANIADWGLILMSDPFPDRSISFLRKYEKQVGLGA